MSAAVPAQPRPWSVGWWTFVASIFTLQLAMIFWLSDPKPMRVRQPNPAPMLELTPGGSEEWLRLMDPTLFALPHVESFSGPAWLKIEARRVPFFEWNEEPAWLQLSATSLVAGISQRTIPEISSWQAPTFAPVPDLPEVLREPLTTAASQVRVEGDLAKRRLVGRVELPPWPAVTVAPTELELVSRTVVQLVVDEGGMPLSAVVLERSGEKAADDLAVVRALGARFEASGGKPQGGPGSELTCGQLVFEWQTVAPTNSP